MVARQAATPARTSPARAYKPHVRILDAEPGLYTVQSERYTYLLYAVDVAQGTCECESGQRQFKGVKRLGGICKHLVALASTTPTAWSLRLAGPPLRRWRQWPQARAWACGWPAQARATRCSLCARAS